MGMTLYECPICKEHLAVQAGNQLSATDGVTVFCISLKCPAQEVFGHGPNEKAAFKIVQEKYKKENEN